QRRAIRHDLSRDDGLGLAREILDLALANAQDDAQSGRDRARELPRDAGVIVTKVAPHFRMADDRADGNAREHRGGDPPGVGALVLPVDEGAYTGGIAASMLAGDRKSTRLNSSHEWISYAVFCLKKKKENT